MKHFLSVNDMTAIEIESLLQMASKFRKEEYTISKQLFAANLFFEPSTRTKSSFVVAQRKLGIETLDFDTETSSMKKGETLYDTAKTFESIGANLLVVRHEADDWSKEIETSMSVPIINAGAGKKDHPTQSLLDADTIFQEFGYFKGLNVVISGDIKHSRVAKSNAQMLSKIGANVFFSGAPDFIDESMQFPYIPIDKAVEMCDVMMLLRIQHERHSTPSTSIEQYHERFGLTKEREQRMKKEAIILHPGPVNRGVEIASELVECDRSRIFKQMSNGVYVRMAVIVKQLLNWGIINENHIKERNETDGNKRIQQMRCVN